MADDTTIDVESDSIDIEITGDSEIALEVAYALSGRATDIHENPDDEFEDVAIELRDISTTIRDQIE